MLPPVTNNGETSKSMSIFALGSYIGVSKLGLCALRPVSRQKFLCPQAIHFIRRSCSKGELSPTKWMIERMFVVLCLLKLQQYPS